MKHTLPLLFQADLLEQGLDAVLLVAPPSRLIMDRGPLPSARACQLPVPPAKARRAPCVTDHLPQDTPMPPFTHAWRPSMPQAGMGRAGSPGPPLPKLAQALLLLQAIPEAPGPPAPAAMADHSWRAAGHCGKIALASSQQLSCPDSPPASCSGCLAFPALLSFLHKVGKSETIL